VIHSHCTSRLPPPSCHRLTNQAGTNVCHLRIHSIHLRCGLVRDCVSSYSACCAGGLHSAKEGGRRHDCTACGGRNRGRHRINSGLLRALPRRPYTGVAYALDFPHSPCTFSPRFLGRSFVAVCSLLPRVLLRPMSVPIPYVYSPMSIPGMAMHGTFPCNHLLEDTSREVRRSISLAISRRWIQPFPR
jgi:hypothetical protein